MRLLHLDIETAPNVGFFWGLYDQTISINQIDKPGYTLCFAAKWHNKKSIIFDSIQKSGMEGMVRHAHDLLSEADAVVHYNGTKFDIPKLQEEIAMQGLDPPTPFSEIDLLKVVRRKFKFASNKLDYVCQRFGIGAKVENKGMPLWIGCMNGDPKCWREMERYNRQDVRLLPRLYERLLPWIENHPNWGHWNSGEIVCRNCGSTNVKKDGVERRTITPYQRYRCLDCRKPLRGRYKLPNENQPTTT